MESQGLLLLLLLISVACAQKLFFKSNKELQFEQGGVDGKDTGMQEGSVEVQVAAKRLRGFGFGKPRHYFTAPRTALELAAKNEDTVVICPGGKSACPAGNTCCLMANNAYGCCPIVNAVCCLDKKHCCPYRTKCDVPRQGCTRNNIFISWYEKTPSFQVDNTAEKLDTKDNLMSVICPDGEHMCGDGQTCCKDGTGAYMCCPLSHATCCSDHIHCCPTNTKCDLEHSRCVHKTDNTFLDWFEKSPAGKMNKSPASEKAVKCDNKHECPTGNTCCKMPDRQWGCCPQPNAVCCSDGVHCCPSGTTCDVSAGKCNHGDIQLDWFEKQPALVTKLENVVCDVTHACPDRHTCCKLTSGQWGCCPLPNAVCCSDGVHCCPGGTTCDVSSGKCNRGDVQLDWFEKQPALITKLENVVCDGTHSCPDRHTCCKLTSGQWGCCPIPNAVCCSDGVHCCPGGTTCDVSSGKCDRGDIQLDWFEKQPALVTKLENVVCDGTHACPDRHTCCKLTSGQWGCCPIPNAVCCSDDVHCCPGGTTCDVSSGKCNRGDVQLDWFEKQPALVTKLENVVCDGTHSCPDRHTCCKLTSGQWGCCPIPNAVCCSDGVHCCPGGTTCDVSSGKCYRGDVQLDWFEKQPALVTKLENVVCDGTHACPDRHTCCKLTSGQWGCCPIPNAVCCSDDVHCCPGGTTCDVSSGKCNRGDVQLDWFEKQPALVTKLENVVCDGTHSCPDRHTCCKLTSGQWGCCPLPNAVCCSDGVHCCPGGTTCDVSSGKCNRGDVQLDWFEKQPALVTKLENVVCDGTHACPDRHTCCKLTSGQWGCCPIPNAVCCSDGVHCCPGGTTCDVSSGKCNRGDVQLDWFEKQPALVTKLENVVCDGTHACPDRHTCCKLTSGQWGCCPIPNAVCCSDGVHCCPGGTTCDVSSGKCNRGDIQLDWFEKQPALVTKLENVVCDGTHACPDRHTCCKLTSGQWGCCPIPNAVCCSDGVHCCPGGTTCDVSSGKCNRGDIQLDWFEKQPALVTKLENVVCDGTHSCPDRHTCCKLTSGQWGCCPIPNAVCCSDGVHCCPGGTTCDVSSGKCNRGDVQLDWFEKQPALVTKLENVVCDGTHSCPDRHTCCKLTSGQWGCCPLPNAVCCSDGVHCCPGGTTCDVSSGKCNRGDVQLDWFEKQPALVTKLENVVCDGTHSCPDRHTCCKLTSGQWGCCPIPNAVCCSDGVHCCPGGTTCDVSSGKCNRGDVQLDWFEKQPALVTKLENVVCDGTHACPDRHTCCKLTSGQWGCCPIPNAVCCSDGVHCCPGGTTCDVSSGKCNRGDIQLDWFEKQPALVTKLENVVCDGTHACPDRHTCCKLTSGQWGCCPIPNAVCCSDGVHCCPGGTTCDVSSGKCNRGDVQLDWFEKQPALVTKLENVVCDGTHACPDRHTCCKLTSGQWGCCPIPNAVCCSDDVHCCPGGTTCDVSSGKCDRGDIQLDWFEKQPALVTKLENVVCDGTHSCPDRHTCCKLTSGQWGCCPIPNAVCCSDDVHCCPSGTTCDVSSGKCNRGDIQLDWFEKQPALVTKLENVVCDGTHSCPDRHTCCKLTSGQWGCCPIPNAVCCSDGVHCCPGGTTCDVSSGKCNRGDIQLDWFEKQPAINVNKVEDVICPDGKHSCPSGNTCCKLSGGNWGCCPLLSAVCCSDGVHCCPSGTTCDVSSGKCNRGDVQLDWFEKRSALTIIEDVICPDGSECEDDCTCCLMDKSEMSSYGCCPLPNAVCCSDNEHCCPHNYACNVRAGTCVQGHIHRAWFSTSKHPMEGMTPKDTQKMLIKHDEIKVENADVQCPNGLKCPDENSCCDDGKGGFNCCPMPEAVCCDDHIHCCPNGYVCNEQPGICRILGIRTGASNFLYKLTQKKGIPLS